MSRWTHSICDEDWKRLNPDRVPVRFVEHIESTCCYCGKVHESGIFVRGNPAETPCRGQGPEHEHDS